MFLDIVILGCTETICHKIVICNSFDPFFGICNPLHCVIHLHRVLQHSVKISYKNVFVKSL